MSSAAQRMMDPEHSDSRRLLAAFLVAVLLHIIVFALFAIVRLESPPNLAPVSVDLVPGTIGGPALPLGPPQAAASTRTQSRSGSEQGFVIPTPRQSTSTAPSQPSGPAFREAGPRNFQTGSVPQATSPVQEPVFPHVKTAQEGTGAATSGGGAPAGASARGVLVEGGGQAPAKGSLDLGSLDTSLAAGAQGTGGQPETGSGGGGGGGGGQGGGGQGKIQWDQPGAAKDRTLLASPQPRIPQWVSKEGLNLTVLVTFTLTPDGLLRDVNVEASSGYNEVDAAVMEALRLWRFSADPSAGNIHGQIPYAIRAR